VYKKVPANKLLFSKDCPTEYANAASLVPKPLIVIGTIPVSIDDGQKEIICVAETPALTDVRSK